MKAYVYAVQYTSEEHDFETMVDRGVIFGKSYTDCVKDIEENKIKENSLVLDIYIVALDKNTISLTEEAYDKLLEGEPI